MVVHTSRPLLRSLDLTYTPPKGTVARWLWTRRMRFEATYAVSMLEPWEKLLVLIIATTLSYLFMSGVVRFLPQHLVFLKSRATYYFAGDGSI
ncbi:hypothetical protein BKA62DRAFT_765800 [Auriculariales sp. MPI-PUGE-AT-0066]|nr:hypothetical protein BKA62DRAFT_765800 [Auriculariales sp. MPI-PUGE-AT-0066]